MNSIGDFATWQDRRRIPPEELAWIESIRGRIVADIRRYPNFERKPAQDARGRVTPTSEPSESDRVP